jgi:pyruvate dehydrogenase E2 component (dihydrolipoamide acetyltransferase)
VRIVDPTPEERTIARRAAESRATIPTVELSVDISSGRRLPSGRLVAACAAALAKHPRANGAYRDGRFELYSRINVGVVMTDGDHYRVPTIFDASAKTPDELSEEMERLSHAGARLPSTAFSGATFTVWNAGPVGLAAASIPVVPPQAAALAAGTRSLTLACDHRILYGAEAAAFLQTIARHLDGNRI